MEFEEKFREKLDYEKTLDKLNERALMARIDDRVEEYHECVMALNDYLIFALSTVVDRDVEKLEAEMNRQVIRLEDVMENEELSPLEYFNYENKRLDIIRKYTKLIHRRIVKGLDTKNLMLKRSMLQTGTEEAILHPPKKKQPEEKKG